MENEEEKIVSSLFEELASVGLDRLKSALLALGMKCGGTLEDRAKRLFSTKNKSVDELDPSLFTKDPKAKRGKFVQRKKRFLSTLFFVVVFSKDVARQKEIAAIEAQIYRLVELLNEQRAATLDNVRRKQAKAGEDLEEEDVDAADLSDDEPDRDEDGMIYNPKNLPLGWDGKVRSTALSRPPS